MANIERVLLDPKTLEANSTMVRTTAGNLVKGTVPIFWPRNEAGVFGQGRTLVEFRVLLDNGFDVSIGTNLETTTNGVTFSFPSVPMNHETRLLAVANPTGARQVARITAIFVDWPTEKTRLADVEAKVADLETRVATLEGANP